MLCEHLRQLEQEMIAVGMRETYRGKPWSSNCREWIFFDCFINIPAVRNRFNLMSCVIDHAHRGTHDGQEQGLECEQCHDAIMGYYERAPDRQVFPIEITNQT